MSVGAIGAVGGASPAGASQGAAASQKPASTGQSAGGSNPTSQTEQSNHAQPAGSSPYCDSKSNMSTSDFVSLTEQVGKGGNEPKDAMDMMKMVVALQIMQKTLEATSKIIDSFISGD